MKPNSQAASAAIGTYAATSASLSPQQAAQVAAAGAQRAAQASGKAEPDTSSLAALAAGIAAAKAGKGMGRSGPDLASLVGTSALAAASGLKPDEKLQSVQAALTKTAGDTGLSAEELGKIASQIVPAANTATAATADTSATDTKGSPYHQAEQAGRAAFKAAAAQHLTLDEQIAAAHKASKDAALATGMADEDAEKIADAVANAVSGGATEEMDPNAVVTIAPSVTGKVTAGSSGYAPLEDGKMCGKLRERKACWFGDHSVVTSKGTNCFPNVLLTKFVKFTFFLWVNVHLFGKTLGTVI